MASTFEFAGKDRRTLTQLLYRINLLIKMDSRNADVNLLADDAVKSLVNNGGTFASGLTRVKNRLLECLAMRRI